jgi:hypothetical protein
MKQNIELMIGAAPRVGDPPRATRAEIKALAAYLSALAESPIDTDIVIGSLKLEMHVDRCRKCWGKGQRRDEKGLSEGTGRKNAGGNPDAARAGAVAVREVGTRSSSRDAGDASDNADATRDTLARDDRGQCSGRGSCAPRFVGYSEPCVDCNGTGKEFDPSPAGVGG